MKADFYSKVAMVLLVILVLFQLYADWKMQEEIKNFGDTNAKNLEEISFILPCIVQTEQSIAETISEIPSWDDAGIQSSRAQEYWNCLPASPIDYTQSLTKFIPTKTTIPPIVHFFLPVQGN